MEYPLILFQLYLPLILSVLSFLCIFIIKKTSSQINIPINILGLAELKIPISNSILKKMLLGILAFTLLGSYLTKDYSELFPSQLEMEVFYDKEGLLNTLEIFSQEEIKRLKINNNDFSIYQEVYYNDIDTKIKEILSCDNFFTLKNGILYSVGTTSIKVEKYRGLQNYYISESRGKLTHTCEQPNRENISFISSFEKTNSPNDYLKPSLLKIFLSGEIILKTVYKQILAEGFKSEGIPFHHTLYGITKVYLFPLPKYSNSLYLYKHPDGGLIPIAYAVYK